MTQIDTKSRILNAAEQLFAKEGYHFTSLRTITTTADANLAAVNYHFGSKEGLLKAVIERRLKPLNQRRADRIEKILSTAATEQRRPRTTDLLRAFIEPTLAFRNEGPGAVEFIALIGRAMNEPDETVRNCFIQQVMPLFILLYEGLKKARPELAEEILLTRLHFVLGAMSHVMCAGARPQISIPGIPQPLTDTPQAEEMIRFACAGLEAPC
ncbi:MAG: hypothetical protein C0618_08225 [Desulfuromonas sp.]|nr:MAG: hypothetical protein C0618_08225 [Desulfuromonas sp.]